MALSLELIGNYADALYSAAVREAAQEQVRAEAERLRDFALAKPDVVRGLSYAFKSARVGKTDKEELLHTLCESLALGGITSRWLGLIARYGRLHLLPHFVEEFVAVYRSSEGLLLATIETAFPLSDEQIARIENALENVLSARVDIRVKENPDLIAGVRAAVEGRTWDLSIRGALESLDYGFA